MYIDAAFSKSIQFCIWFQRQDKDNEVHLETVDIEKCLNLLGETYINSSKSYVGFDTVGQYLKQDQSKTSDKDQAVQLKDVEVRKVHRQD